MNNKMINEIQRKMSPKNPATGLALSSSSFENIFNFENESIALNTAPVMKPKITLHLV